MKSNTCLYLEAEILKKQNIKWMHTREWLPEAASSQNLTLITSEAFKYRVKGLAGALIPSTTVKSKDKKGGIMRKQSPATPGIEQEHNRQTRSEARVWAPQTLGSGLS